MTLTTPTQLSSYSYSNRRIGPEQDEGIGSYAYYATTKLALTERLSPDMAMHAAFTFQGTLPPSLCAHTEPPKH